MALSKPVAGDGNDFLSCPICSETFKTPKILPCFHTFCQQCIHEFIVSVGHTESESRISEFKCPVCKTTVTPNNVQMATTEWASGLQNNETISMIIAMQKDGKRQECHACKRDNEESEAKVWCKECVEALCDKCTAMHHRMKLSCEHVVVPIDDIGQKMTGIDLHAISDKCPKHPIRTIEAYCGEHKELCCILCLTTRHRACMNVKEVTQEFEQTDSLFKNTLVDIKDSTIKLLDLREKERGDFNSSVENTKEDATKLVKVLKCKIDELFDTFIKQLHMFQDEQNTKEDVRIRLLNQLLRNVSYWIGITKSVKDFGTNAQYFMYTERTKEQLNSSIEELIMHAFKNETYIAVTLGKTELIQKLENIEQIGNLCTSAVQLDVQLRDLCVLRCFMPKFDDIKVVYIRSYHFPGSSLICGVCLDSEYLIVGDNSNGLHVILKENGQIMNTTSVDSQIKRMCLDRQNKLLFVSCYKKKLLRANIHGNNIANLTEIKFSNSGSYGDVCILNGNIYVSMVGHIRAFRSTVNAKFESPMTTCFETNTNCENPALNSIAVLNGEQLVYNSKNSEIKCSTIDGKEIFCFKDDVIKSPDCLSGLPSGLVLVVDSANKGSLHVISSDGKNRRLLFERFENIQRPTDIWMDTNNEIVYVSGGEYVELYRII